MFAADVASVVDDLVASPSGAAGFADETVTMTVTTTVTTTRPTW